MNLKAVCRYYNSQYEEYNFHINRNVIIIKEDL